MATVIISNLPPPPSGTGSGSSKGTDLFPATDVTNTSSAASGTTKKYTLSEIYNFMLSAAGLTTYEAVRVGTPSALTATYDNGASGVGATLTNSGAQAALAIDGVTLAITNRVLVFNQGTSAQNGIYVVTNIGSSSTNWVLTRALDYNQASEIIQYGVVLINQGNTYAGLLYQETAPGPFVIGSSTITFAPFTSHSFTFPISLSQGGTSAALTADNGGIFYSTASAGAILASTATAGKVLQSGASSAPSWSTPTYPSASGTAGKILASDGTNIVYSTSTFPTVGGAAGNILISNGTNYVASTSLWPNTVGAAGTIIRSNGTSNAYSTSTFADTYAVSTLLYASSSNTVTGLATANSAMLYTNSSGVPAWTASATNGQLLIGSTGASPALATLTAGTGISITNGAGTITIDVSGSGLAWSTIAGTSQNAAVNNGYVVGNAAQTTITLPATFAVGDVVIIKGFGAAGWILAANTGDTIQLGQSATSSGGTLTSAANFDTVQVTGIVANTTWSVDYVYSSGLTVA